MVILIPALLVAAASLGLHYRQWRRGATPQFILAAVPPALLFLILPVPVRSFQTIHAFGRVGHDAGIKSMVVDLCLQTDRLLWAGSLACMATMIAAGFLQWRLTAAAIAPDGPSDTLPGQPDAIWPQWLLGGCALIAVPAAVLVFVAADVPRLSAAAMEISESTTPPPPSALAPLSEQISARLVAGTVAGAGMTVLALAATAAALFAAGRIGAPRRPARYSWAVLAAIVVGAGLSAVRLQSDMTWIQRVTASAIAHEAADR